MSHKQKKLLKGKLEGKVCQVVIYQLKQSLKSLTE